MLGRIHDDLICYRYPYQMVFKFKNHYAVYKIYRLSFYFDEDIRDKCIEKCKETGLDNLIQFFENFQGDKFEIYYYGQTLLNLKKRLCGHQSHLSGCFKVFILMSVSIKYRIELADCCIGSMAANNKEALLISKYSSMKHLNMAPGNVGVIVYESMTYFKLSTSRYNTNLSTIKLCKIPLVSVPTNVAQTTVDLFCRVLETQDILLGSSVLSSEDFRQFKADRSQKLQSLQQQTRQPELNIDFNTKLYFRLSIYKEKNGDPLYGCINYRSPKGDVVNNHKAFKFSKDELLKVEALVSMYDSLVKSFNRGVYFLFGNVLVGPPHFTSLLKPTKCKLTNSLVLPALKLVKASIGGTPISIDISFHLVAQRLGYYVGNGYGSQKILNLDARLVGYLFGNHYINKFELLAEIYQTIKDGKSYSFSNSTIVYNTKGVSSRNDDNGFPKFLPSMGEFIESTESLIKIVGKMDGNYYHREVTKLSVYSSYNVMKQLIGVLGSKTKIDGTWKEYSKLKKSFH
ncbi:hypothetical protein ACTFIR_005015 [Dictyostelium discoideum]